MLVFYLSRLLHRLQQWIEDRSVEEATYVQQMKKLWAPERKKVLYLNLQLRRDQRRKVA